MGINLTYLHRKHLSYNVENSKYWLPLLKKFVCEVAWISFKPSAISSKNSDINVDVAKWYLIFNAQTDLSDYSRYLLLICNKSVCYLDHRLTVQNVDQNIMYKFTNFIKYPCSRIHMWGKQDKKVLNMSKQALFTPFLFFKLLFSKISKTVRFFFLHSYFIVFKIQRSRSHLLFWWEFQSKLLINFAAFSERKCWTLLTTSCPSDKYQLWLCLNFKSRRILV